MSDHEKRADGNEIERGKRAGFDPASGEVHGAGAGAGANANPGEDYANDSIAGDGDDQMGGPKPASQGVVRPIDRDEGN